MMSDRELLDVALTAAEAGAAVQLRYEVHLGAGRPRIDTKASVVDLVTHVDREAEAAILEVLRDTGIAIIAEEGTQTQGQGDDVWYVDPLDGTTNFAHGHPFHCVSIGLMRAGEPLLGVVHAPMLGVVWSGGPTLGAERHDRVRDRRAPLSVSTTREMHAALFATGFPYDRHTSDDDNLAAHRAIIKRGQGVMRCGSAALDLSLVAEGTYEGFWERRLKPWDLCAGVALVRAAGGKATGARGDAFVATRGDIAASNGHVHADFIAAIAPHFPPLAEAP